MKRQTTIMLTAVAMLLSASLVMAQGSTAPAPATPAKAAAVAPAKPVTAAAPAKAATAVAPAKAATAVAPAKPATAVAPAKPVAAVVTAKPATAMAPTKSAAALAPAKAAAMAAVDLNSASKADLMKLPGIGEAISAKIIAGRPWANKAQLLAKGILTKPAYDKLGAQVIAKQAK